MKQYLYFTDKFQIKDKNDAKHFLIRKRKFSAFSILVYHRVNNEYDPYFKAIPIEIFEKQMQILSENFNVLSLEELIELKENKKPIPDNAISITFDDGYKDNFENAFPILKKFELPATVFITTGSIDTGNFIWHDRVFHIFKKLHVNHIFLNGKKFDVAEQKEKIYALNYLLGTLRKLGSESRNEMINNLQKDLNILDVQNHSSLMLSWEDIKVMKKHKISFGVHTETHPILSRIPIVQAEEEIEISKKTLERELNCEAKLFAYPNGRKEDYNTAIKKILNDQRFIGAVTTIFGTNSLDCDRLELSRIGLWDHDPKMCVVKLGLYKILN